MAYTDFVYFSFLLIYTDNYNPNLSEQTNKSKKTYK